MNKHGRIGTRGQAMPTPNLHPNLAPAVDRKAQWSLLALLRFVLAYIVFCWHLPREYFAGRPYLDFAAGGATAAVIGFLLISGFSIAASLTREPRHFYRRRFLRIYPLYFCAICLAQAAGWYLGPRLHSSGLPTTAGNFLMLQGIACVQVSADPVVWSLSVECLFYLLAPFFLQLGYRGCLLLVSLSGLVFIACIGGWIRAETVFLYGISHAAYLWAWLLGFMYYLWKGRTTVGLLLVGAVLVEWAFSASAFFSMATYLVSLLAITLVPSWKIPGKVSAVMQYLGDLSYPAYLFHSIVITVLTLATRNKSLGVVIAGVAVTTLFFHHVVDVYLKQRYLTPWLLGRSPKHSGG